MRVVDYLKIILSVLLLVVFLASSAVGVMAEEPDVHVVIFWMNGCGHCHYVLQNILPPLQDQYGEQLEIKYIELVTIDEVDLIYAIAAAYGIDQDGIAVPFLIIGDEVLIGSAEVDERLPGLIEEHLAAGGVDYPDIPLLREVLPKYGTENPDSSPFIIETMEEAPAEATAVPSETITIAPSSVEETKVQSQLTATTTLDAGAAQTELPTQALPIVITPTHLPGTLTPEEIFLGEGTSSNGYALAMVVIVCMVAALLFVGIVLWRAFTGRSVPSGPTWLGIAIPVLALIGLGIAGYLSYVETQLVEAFCGPVGDCTAVQASPYARLFGVIPIGVLGVLGYLAILAAWVWGRIRSHRWSKSMFRVIFVLALFGTLFSLYLTYLEPFVIKAVCMWCLSSAVIMTLLLLLSLFPALEEGQEG
jgi:uncharacterized membrane protein/thiol-disulfide isomerase/thioredoxin